MFNLYGQQFKKLLYESYQWYTEQHNISLQNKTPEMIQSEADTLFYPKMDEWLIRSKNTLPIEWQEIMEQVSGKTIGNIDTLSAKLCLEKIKVLIQNMSECPHKTAFIHTIIRGINIIIQQGHTNEKEAFDQIHIAQGKGNCVSRNTLFAAWLNEAGIEATPVIIKPREIRAIGRHIKDSSWENSQMGHVVVLCKTKTTHYAIPQNALILDKSDSTLYEIHEVGKHGPRYEYTSFYLLRTGEISLKTIPPLTLQDINEKSAHSLFYKERGIRYSEQGEYDKAIADCTRAITLDPTFAGAYVCRATSYYEQSKNNYTNAIIDYTKAIALDPEFLEAYHNRGVIYAYFREYDRANADFDKAIALGSSYTRWVQLGLSIKRYTIDLFIELIETISAWIGIRSPSPKIVSEHPAAWAQRGYDIHVSDVPQKQFL